MAVKYEDYYKVLGIKRDATQKEIQTAYRKLARKYHPDVNKDATAEANFKKVNEANEVLRDPEKRKMYDQLGANWKDGQDVRPPSGWSQGERRSAQGFSQTGADGFSDFFDMFFGGSTRQRSPFETSFGQRQGSNGRAEWSAAGEDIHSELSLSIEDIFRGGSKKILMTKTSYDNNGMPFEDKKELEVKIPPGITEGSKIRLKGQGESGTGNGQPGDLLLKVKILPDSRFQVRGHDLELKIKIDLWDALLGATVDVKIIEDTIQMKIPQGTQPGQRFRVRGKGLRKNADINGDLYVIAGIDIPKDLDEEDKKEIEKIAAKHRR